MTATTATRDPRGRFRSGSTGNPKGVMLTYRNFSATIGSP